MEDYVVTMLGFAALLIFSKLHQHHTNKTKAKQDKERYTYKHKR
jgi:hypothetical protein